MNNGISIGAVPLEKVWEVRHRVMYPSLDPKEVRLPLDSSGEHLGVYHEGTLVSVISLFTDGGDLQFRKFATEPPEQGKGFGKLLLEHVVGLARQRGIRRIWCNARRSATALYERYGMKQQGEEWEQYGIRFVKMSLQLTANRMEIIPAIDIIGGKCVRLTEGDYSQLKVYNEDPLEAAMMFQDAGIRRLHLVDLDGAKNKRVTNWKVLERLASRTGLQIDFGGGISAEADVRIVFDCGAAFATIGSIAVKDPAEFSRWLLIFGAEKFLLGADVKDRKIAIHGWLEQTGIDIDDFIGDNIQRGVKQLFCTDISKDGKLEGPATELYKDILKHYPSLHLIASGGVATVADLHDLQDAGCAAAIVGKAIYEKRISINDLKLFIPN